MDSGATTTCIPAQRLHGFRRNGYMDSGATTTWIPKKWKIVLLYLRPWHDTNPTMVYDIFFLLVSNHFAEIFAKILEKQMIHPLFSFMTPAPAMCGDLIHVSLNDLFETPAIALVFHALPRPGLMLLRLVYRWAFRNMLCFCFIYFCLRNDWSKEEPDTSRFHGDIVIRVPCG